MFTIALNVRRKCGHYTISVVMEMRNPQLMWRYHLKLISICWTSQFHIQNEFSISKNCRHEHWHDERMHHMCRMGATIIWTTEHGTNTRNLWFQLNHFLGFCLLFQFFFSISVFADDKSKLIHFVCFSSLHQIKTIVCDCCCFVLSSRVTEIIPEVSREIQKWNETHSWFQWIVNSKSWLC